MAILLALYLEPVLRLPGSRKYGYVDDIVILNIGRSLEETARATAKDDAAVKALRVQLGISFDKEKVEVIYFTRANNPDLPLVVLSVGGTVELREKDLRYLGVRLDRKLTF